MSASCGCWFESSPGHHPALWASFPRGRRLPSRGPDRARLATLLLLILLSCEASAPLPLTPEAVRPLPVGSPVPELQLRTVDGESIELGTFVGVQPLVLIFFWGTWCTYCMVQLAELHQAQSRIAELGYQLVAVSADQPEKLLELVQKHGLKYQLLSDTKLHSARAFGVAFKMDEALITKYDGFLREASGESHQTLPVPSVFIIGKDRRIKFVHWHPDHAVRMSGQALLSAAKAALE